MFRSLFTIANINVTKLDFAFDIDPLFHKMSQQFDEGGAKGLLLVNLGVASDGCRLVLDSREDTVSEFTSEPHLVIDEDIMALDGPVIADASFVIQNHSIYPDPDPVHQINIEPRSEGIIDITHLRDKLQELILIAPLESIDLVPQLKELRCEYDLLRSLGFSDVTVSESKVCSLISS